MNTIKSRSHINKHRKSNKRTMHETKIDKNLIEEYLQGSREESLANIAYSLNRFNLNEIKPILKNGIYNYLKCENPELNGKITIKRCFYQLISDFDVNQFIERRWQYRPYLLNNHEYLQLQTCNKNPVHIKNYDYTIPFYHLNNNFFFNNRKKKRLNKYSEEKIKNDIQFYFSKELNVLCAKLITLKYKPINLQLIKKHYREIENAENGLLSGEVVRRQKQLVEHDALYSRSLSLSMYVLLEGSPDKAMPFFRYDNEEGEHNNVYIGDDKRRAIFGDKAKSPHFHFQNETDSLLCLRKYNGEESHKYKTGRCNAIDIEHLRKYLTYLDKLDEYEIDRQLDNNLHYGMPFLTLKSKKRAVNIFMTSKMYLFFKEKTEEELAKISYVKEWLDKAKENKAYKNNDGRKFGKVLKALDFLEFICEKRKTSQDLEERNLLSQIEIICADSMLNAFASCQSNELSSQKQDEIIEIDGFNFNATHNNHQQSNEESCINEDLEEERNE